MAKRAAEALKRCTLIRRRREKTRKIEHFKKKGDQQFKDDGRKAEMTFDLILQARAQMSDNKVNGPEDKVVSEMIKQLPLEKIYIITRCCQELHGSDGSSKIMEDCETGVLSKTRRGTKERDQKLQGHCAHIGDVEVVRLLYYSASGKKRT